MLTTASLSRAFRDRVHPVLLALAWRPSADPESREALDWLAGDGEGDWVCRILDDPAATDLDAAGEPAALQLLLEVLLLESMEVGPEGGWLRPRAGGRSPAWQAALPAVLSRAPRVGEAAWLALGEGAANHGLPRRLAPVRRRLLLQICREVAAPANVVEDAGATLLSRRAAASPRGPALFLTPEPIPVEGHPDWALSVTLRPTLERDLYLVQARLVSRATSHPAPPPTVRFRLEVVAGGEERGGPWRVAADPPDAHEEYLEVPAGAELRLRAESLG